MSYLSELNNLVGAKKKSELQKTFSPKLIYTTLLERLLGQCIWVKYDSYNDIAGAYITAAKPHRGADRISRVDLRPTPTLTTKSVPLFQAVEMLCIENGSSYANRGQIVSDLKIRQSKVVLSASLRPFDDALVEAYGADTVEETKQQQRCVIFPLERLTSLAEVELDSVIPDSEKFFS